MSGRADSTRSSDPLPCGEVRELLALVPGADLPAAKDRAVRDHLADCPSCRQELGGYLRARRALRSLTPAGVGAAFGADDSFFADLRRDTLARVRRDRDRRESHRHETLLRRRRSIAALLTAAALFLLGVYLVLQWLPAPEIVFPKIPHHAPVLPVDSRFRNVGYGLSGHRAVFDDLTVPLPEARPTPTVQPATKR